MLGCWQVCQPLRGFESWKEWRDAATCVVQPFGKSQLLDFLLYNIFNKKVGFFCLFVFLPKKVITHWLTNAYSSLCLLSLYPFAVRMQCWSGMDAFLLCSQRVKTYMKNWKVIVHHKRFCRNFNIYKKTKKKKRGKKTQHYISKWLILRKCGQ